MEDMIGYKVFYVNKLGHLLPASEWSVEGFTRAHLGKEFRYNYGWNDAPELGPFIFFSDVESAEHFRKDRILDSPLAMIILRITALDAKPAPTHVLNLHYADPDDTKAFWETVGMREKTCANGRSLVELSTWKAPYGSFVSDRIYIHEGSVNEIR